MLSLIRLHAYHNGFHFKSSLLEIDGSYLTGNVSWSVFSTPKVIVVLHKFQCIEWKSLTIFLWYSQPDRQYRLPIFSSRASSAVGQENFKITKVQLYSSTETLDDKKIDYIYPSTMFVSRHHDHHPRFQIDSSNSASVQAINYHYSHHTRFISNYVICTMHKTVRHHWW